MAFTSWAAIYSQFKDALASMTTQQMLQAGFTPGGVGGQTVTFRRFEDIMKYEEFLKSRAAEESNTGGRRSSAIGIGYGGLD